MNEHLKQSKDKNTSIKRQVYLKIASEHKDQPGEIVGFAKELELLCQGWL